jgi:hypothetical protein
MDEAFGGSFHFLQSGLGLSHDRFVAMLYQFAVSKSFYHGRCVA